MQIAAGMLKYKNLERMLIDTELIDMTSTDPIQNTIKINAEPTK